MTNWAQGFLCIVILILTNIAQANTTTRNFIHADDLYRNTDVFNIQLSPTGNYVSYAVRKNNSTFIEFYNVKNHKRKEVVSFVEGNYLNDYVWINSSHLYVNLVVDGQNKDLVLRFYYGREQRIFTEWHVLGDGYLVDSMPSDRNHLIYAKENSDDNNQLLYKIHLSDLKNKKFRKEDIIDESPDDLVKYIFDSRENRIVGIFLEKDEEDNNLLLKYKTVNTKQWRHIFSIADDEYTFLPVHFVSDNKLAVLTNKETDKVVVQLFDINSQKLEQILYTHEDYDLTNATFSVNGELQSVEFTSGGVTIVDHVEAVGSALQKRFNQTFDNGFPYIMQTNEQADLALVSVHGSNNPGRVYLFEGLKNEFSELASSIPALSKYNFAETSSFKVNNNNGDLIEAYITRPLNDALLNHKVLIVNPHGGPIGVRDSARFNKDHQFLVNRGFTILTVNFRGSSGYGKAFLDSGKAEFGQAIEDDITTVVNHVLGQETFTNICAMGSSYGAFSSLMLAMQHPATYDCVIAGFGIYDIPLLFNSSNFDSLEARKKKLERVVGTNSRDKLDISPLYHLEKLQAPLLMIAGKKDYVASFEHSARMELMLKKMGKEFEFIAYEDAKHGHVNWNGDQHEMASIVDFLYRKLDIDFVQFDDASDDDQNKQAWAHDYALMGKYAASDRYIQKDEEKAFSFNVKAAKLGSQEAKFALAKQYLKGIGTADNSNNALALLQSVTEKEHLEATRLLAKLYLDGEQVERDIIQSKTLFERAIKMEPGFKSTLDIAQFYCLADAEYKDVKLCSEEYWSAYKLRSTYNQRRLFEESFSESIVDGIYTPLERDLLNALVSKIYEIPDLNIDVTIDDNGIYEYQMNRRFGRGGERILAGSQSVDANIGMLLTGNNVVGVRYDVDTDGIFNASDQAIVIVKLETFNKKGALIDTLYFHQIRELRDDWAAYINLSSHRVGNTYRLSLFDAQGNAKFSDTIDASEPLEKENRSILDIFNLNWRVNCRN